MTNKPISLVTRIEMLRHGLPEGEHCFRGRTEFALTEQGMQQMQNAVAELDSVDTVITSPRVRCRHFAQEFASDHGVELIQDSGFQELNFGAWDGKEKQAVWESDQQRLMAFWENPWQTTPPNGESLHDFDQRISEAWQCLLDVHQGKTVLLVTHGGVIKQVLRQILDMPRNGAYLQRLNIAYGSRVTISVYRDENNKLWPEVIWPSV
ncbi:histidine phosphatase family protein [Thaumasiovibrio sp. DFM-14]|uniref:histidine phosphatase family protein n=1 Tax=Thaumasiovibrio sp. DFM-14 TaxID=3384792 RepID=UPI0039A230AF